VLPVIITTALMVIAPIYLALDIHNRTNQLTTSIKIIDLESENSIIYLDEVLTMSARMGAYTGEPEWQKRYNENELLLDIAIKSLLELQENSGSKALIKFLKKTDITNQKLIYLEKKSFKYSNSGNLEDAQNLLLSKEYRSLKETYSKGIKGVIRVSKSEIKNNIRNLQSLESIFVICWGLISIGWIFVCINYFTAKKKNKKLIKETSIANEQSNHITKLATIGELAAGVGHEINNPLYIANSNVEMIKKRLEEIGVFDSDVSRYIHKYKNASHRIKNIVQGLRTFSRVDSDEMKLLALNPMVDETGMLLKEIYEKNGVTLYWDMPVDSTFIKGNPGRIQQGLMNLLSNAKDATNGQARREIDIKLSVEGDRTILAVKDSGCGIPKAIQHQVCEAFYTTKEPGKGTGIGLNLTSKIMIEHTGRLHFESNSAGTIFYMEFPTPNAQVILSAKTNEHSKVTIPEKAQKVDYATTKVLIVDDEQDLRDAIIYSLNELGIENITEAENGKVALDKLKTEGFDIVFTDMKMPIMDGPTFIRKAREENLVSDPLLFAVTGGTELDFADKDGDGGLNHLIDGFLLKPYELEDMEELLQKRCPPPKEEAA
jgi:signal transduction histidine kinase/CheY-like chemotaxis protein